MDLATRFARSSFARFINSSAGRMMRIIVGLVLIIWGYTQLEGNGIILVIIGFVPLAAGGLDLCVISPLIGGPVSGKKVRAMCDAEDASR